MENKCKIYIVTHKKFQVPNNSIYEPIQVGKKRTNIDLKIASDDTGDNIADKNANYCELTALYWIWKNIKKVKVIGICHYRRYFTKLKWSNKEKFFLKQKDINRLLDKYEIIVPKKTKLKKYSVKDWYVKCDGREKDLVTTKKVIEELFPDYAESYETVLQQSEAFYCNMFIMKKELMDKYCEWLFKILSLVEEKTDLSDYSPTEARIYGYLSEILLNVWVLKNKLNYCEISVVNIETSLKWKLQHRN